MEPVEAPEGHRDPHRCGCGVRFEVAYDGDPLDDPVPVDVTCPRCGKTHSVAVPRESLGTVVVECLPGPDPETGGQG